MNTTEAIKQRIQTLQARITQHQKIANDWLNNSAHAMYQADKEIESCKKQIKSLQSILDEAKA